MKTSAPKTAHQTIESDHLSAMKATFVQHASPSPSKKGSIVPQDRIATEGSQIKVDESKQESSHSTQKVFAVPADDFNFELPETGTYYQEELMINIKIFKNNSSKTDQRDIFKNADFWLGKGTII